MATHRMTWLTCTRKRSLHHAFLLLSLLSALLLSVGHTTNAVNVCHEDRCLCTYNTTTSSVLSPPLDTDKVEWRNVALATATGVLTSTMVLSVVAAWWMWSSESPGLPDGPSREATVSDRRSLSSAASSTSSGSWATPRRNSQHSSRVRDINIKTDSRGSNSSLFKSGRVWP